MPLSNKRSSVFPGFMSIQGQTIGQNLNLGPEYTAKTAAKMQNIERRQQIANVLLQQAFQPKEARQAGRFVVAPSNIEQLSGPASALASAVASYYLDKEREKTALDEMDAVKQAYSTFAADTAPIQPYRAAHEPDTAAVPGQAAVPAVPSNLDSIIGQANPQSRTAVTDALLGTQAPPPQIRALPVGPPPLSREFSSAPSALPASYDLGTAGQAAVPAVPAQLGARLSNEELLAKANIPMILNSDATGTIQDPVRAKEAVRPDEMGRDRTESEIRQAQMALVSSGVPNAWNMVAMDSQQRQADEARKDALKLRESEVTYQDLGDKVAVMKRGQLIGYFPKGVAPKGTTYLDAGGTLIPVNDQGQTSGPSIVKSLTPGETTNALNQIIRLNPITGKAELNPDYVEARTNITKAGASSVAVNSENFVPANVKVQQEFMEGIRKQYEVLSSIPATLKNLDAAKALIPGAKDFMGTGGPQILNLVKFFNNRLGTTIDIEGITNAEELRSRLFNNILNDLKKLDAQPSQQQQNTLSDALGNLTTDPNALPKVLDAYAEILRNKVSIYNETVDSSESRGVRFPFDAHIVIPPLGFADTGNKDENGNMIFKKRGVNGAKDEYQVFKKGK